MQQHERDRAEDFIERCARIEALMEAKEKAVQAERRLLWAAILLLAVGVGVACCELWRGDSYGDFYMFPDFDEQPTSEALPR